MVLKAILVGLIAAYGRVEQSWFGQQMIARPIWLCTLVGLVLGDLTTGVMIGGTLELVWAGIVQIGAAPTEVVSGSVVRPVLMQLRQAGLPIACASSSRMEYIKKTLGDSGLLDLFDLAVTCDDFESSKPQPDIYLYCARYFGVSPAECLVVEDSPIGIAAGKNAGMTVAARIDHHFGMDQSRADYFIEDLTALPALIEHLSDVHPVC